MIVDHDPEDIADRFWNLPQKGEEEDHREELFMDDIILEARLDREIESRISGVRIILDAGAAYILLAVMVAIGIAVFINRWQGFSRNNDWSWELYSRWRSFS